MEISSWLTHRQHPKNSCRGHRTGITTEVLKMFEMRLVYHVLQLKARDTKLEVGVIDTESKTADVGLSTEKKLIDLMRMLPIVVRRWHESDTVKRFSIISALINSTVKVASATTVTTRIRASWEWC